MFSLDGRYWALYAYALIESLILTAAMLAFFVPALLIYPLFLPAGLLVLERRMAPIDAIQESARAVATSYWVVLAASIVIGLYAALGLILCCVGIVLTAAIVEIVPALVYRDLFEPIPSEPFAEPPAPTFEA